MYQVYTTNIWSKLRRSINKAEIKRAGIAFVSSKDLINFSSRDLLICNASDSAIKSGETSAKALKTFHDKGAIIYSHSNLHAKFLVFDNKVLIGSNNLSASSDKQLTELAILSDSAIIRSQVVAFLYSLIEEAEEIDESFLKRILKIPVSKRQSEVNLRLKPPKRIAKSSYGHRFWIISTREIDESRYKNELAIVENAIEDICAKYEIDHDRVSWMRWTGNSKFRKLSKPGDTVVQICKAEKGQNIIVYPPVPILKKQNHARWTRFYYEQPSEKKIKKWNQFSLALKKMGLTSIKINSEKEVSNNHAILIDSIWKR